MSLLVEDPHKFWSPGFWHDGSAVWEEPDAIRFVGAHGFPHCFFLFSGRLVHLFEVNVSRELYTLELSLILWGM